MILLLVLLFFICRIVMYEFISIKIVIRVKSLNSYHIKSVKNVFVINQ